MTLGGQLCHSQAKRDVLELQGGGAQGFLMVVDGQTLEFLLWTQNLGSATVVSFGASHLGHAVASQGQGREEGSVCTSDNFLFLMGMLVLDVFWMCFIPSRSFNLGYAMAQ